MHQADKRLAEQNYECENEVTFESGLLALELPPLPEVLVSVTTREASLSLRDRVLGGIEG